MRSVDGEILYIGKAGNLRRRVSSYFERPQTGRIERLVASIKTIDFKETTTVLEALILEATLIKKYLPPYNIKDKDNKSFLYVVITDEEFPRIILARGRNRSLFPQGEWFGPFIYPSHIREALKILRRIFPYNTHDPATLLKLRKGRGCFDFQIGLCPGTCASAITKREYARTVSNVRAIFEGKLQSVLKKLRKKMEVSAKRLEFEEAEKLKRQVFALEHIQDVALISDSEIYSEGAVRDLGIVFRIEGYDISNISGTSATGSMVVFHDGKPAKEEYRKFRIKTIHQPNDVGMLRETLMRRFKRNDWPLPQLIVIDGGLPQVRTAKNVLLEYGLVIPVLGIAKGPDRKKNEIIGHAPFDVDLQTLINVRDEAHRFAVSYHRFLRSKNMVQ